MLLVPLAAGAIIEAAEGGGPPTPTAAGLTTALVFSRPRRRWAFCISDKKDLEASGLLVEEAFGGCCDAAEAGDGNVLEDEVTVTTDPT